MTGNWLMTPRPRIKPLVHNERGSTAIEFAMIAPVFLALILGIIEVGILNIRMNVIADSVDEAARTIRVGGQFQTAASACADEAACFAEEFCDYVRVVASCNPGTDFTYDVASFDNFGALAADNGTLDCPGEGGGGATAPAFNAGDSSAVVRMRVCYELSVTNPYLRRVFPSGANGRLRFTKTAIFANEPF